MQCTSPLLALWYKPQFSISKPPVFRQCGKFVSLEKPLFFKSKNVDKISSLREMSLDVNSEWQKSDFLDVITIPCGRCIACRLNKASEWATRNICELRYHDSACFLTLTFSPEKIKILPCVNGEYSLAYKPFQDFMKRLRLNHSGISYYMCGEYGENYERPHYHVLLYGYDFPDRVLFRSHSGNDIFISDELASLWPFGFHTIGSISLDSINYVCRYIMKKQYGQSSFLYDGRMPEFTRMSLKPAIGKKFFEEFTGKDFNLCYNGKWFNDFLSVGERKVKLPRYFDKLFNVSHPEQFESLKFYRSSKVKLPTSQDLCQELAYIEAVTKNRLKKGDYNV